MTSKIYQSMSNTFYVKPKRQIVLDSVQGRSPNLAFLPVVTIPELETWIETWAFSETIHSRSYTHIIRNVYPNPSKVFDEMMDIQEIVDCVESISKHYDEFIEMIKWYELFGEGEHNVKSEQGRSISVDGREYKETESLKHYTKNISLYELKKKLYLCLASVNILEGLDSTFLLRVVGFSELKKMEGNAKIIKLIARDENVHLGSTQQILKLLPQDDPDFAKIAKECEQEVVDMFIEAIDQEKSGLTICLKMAL